MAMFHGSPNRAEPSATMWFSVETPSVFKEVKLPSGEQSWTRANRLAFRALETIAEQHGTHIRRSNYRRG